MRVVFYPPDSDGFATPEILTATIKQSKVFYPPDSDGFATVTVPLFQIQVIRFFIPPIQTGLRQARSVSNVVRS